MSDKFYLGKLHDPTNPDTPGEPLLYDPGDLTTHGVVVGMTGSGKTGLCIAMMEEAALQGIPAILIDPKGDLSNLLLHFPDLAPQDFQPWLDPELARRSGKTLEQASVDAAQTWRKGLTEWGIGRERMLALRNAAQFAVYTPGSDAGIPVSVLSSMAAPGLEWSGNREILTERIASTVTALLGLVGYDDIDPIRSREHILLANIFQHAWSQNTSLDLNELILQIQTPPFEKLGAFAVDAFLSAKERTALALQINNILAAPSFELWRSGQPLDIASLLYTQDGRPRHSVFYLAHLSESERMFFVTLLLSMVETWMRTQAGATSLRALLYMDELYGYMPPTRNPSSKQPLLRMLKQARAFGVGLLLATQNPVDLDYKALSNAGTWFIGKLQTEQDKQRLLDGLESAASGALDRSTLDKLISSLAKRVFIMNNIHARQPTLFETRWTMNFLAGPITRAQIPALNKLVGAGIPPVVPNTVPGLGDPTGMIENAVVPEGFTPLPGEKDKPAEIFIPAINDRQAKSAPQASLTRPGVPIGIPEYFLPLNMSLPKAAETAGAALATGSEPVEVIYRPALAASAQVRFLERKYNLDLEQVRSALVVDPDRRGIINWELSGRQLPDASEMDPAPDPRALFAPLEAPLSDLKSLAVLKKDFADWVYRTSKVVVRTNTALGLSATPEVSQAEFMKACATAAREARDVAVVKATASIDRQIQTLQDRIAREERELKMDETELGQRKGEELATHAENILGVFGKTRSNRRLSSSLTKRRLTEQAKEDVQELIDSLEQYRSELEQLVETRQQAVQNAGEQWGEVVNKIAELSITPKKTDIYIPVFGIAWVPFYLVKRNDQTVEIPANG